MTNYYTEEWKWLLKNAIDWKTILPLYYSSFPTEDFENEEELQDFFEEILTQVSQWSDRSIAPRARLLDEKGAGVIENDCTVPSKELQEFYKEAAELGFFGLAVPEKYDGLGAPVTLSLFGTAQIGRGCSASFIQMGAFIFTADMLERFCSPEICEKYIPQIVAGKISGCMCLTEPNSGSDVGSLRTKAVATEDGKYLLNGAKIFISNGGGGLALVLARKEGAPQGLKGLSLFFVEEWTEVDGKKHHNYKITKNEDKMGLHGSFTCEVLFENSVATQVGSDDEGFKIMLHLMNEARIATGIQALGGIEACLERAFSYAQERKQFGKPVADLPLMKRNLANYKAEMDAFRALIVDTISWYDIYQKLDLKAQHGTTLSTEEKQLFFKAKKCVRRRTPIVKYYGSEAYANLSLKAIQVHGGYGFMKEYDVERLHRDSIGALLYEGTSQIQSLMSLKDLLKAILSNPKRWFGSLIKGHPFAGYIEGCEQTTKTFREAQYSFKKNFTSLVIKCLRLNNISVFLHPKNWQKQENIDRLMIHAETCCQALSYLETLRVLDQHAQMDDSRKELFWNYYELVMPRLAGIYSDWKIYKPEKDASDASPHEMTDSQVEETPELSSVS